MQDSAQQLSSLGFSHAQAQVYEALLRHGSQSISLLSKRTKLSPKKLAGVLAGFESRKIVARARSGRNILFTAEDPKTLVELLAEEDRRIGQRKDSIAKLLEPLRAAGVRTAARPRVGFFAGQDAARTALEDTLRSKDKTLRAFFSTADLTEFLGAEFYDHYTKRRVSAGVTLHVLRTFERDKRKMKTNKFSKMFLGNKPEKREVRFVSEDTAFPLTLFLYDQKLLGIASKEENFAFIIESKELYQMQKKLFDLTWKTVAIRTLPSG